MAFPAGVKQAPANENLPHEMIPLSWAETCLGQR